MTTTPDACAPTCTEHDECLQARALCQLCNQPLGDAPAVQIHSGMVHAACEAEEMAHHGRRMRPDW